MSLTSAARGLKQKIFAHELLNVTRDVMDFDYLLRSDVYKEDVQYDL